MPSGFYLSSVAGLLPALWLLAGCGDPEPGEATRQRTESPVVAPGIVAEIEREMTRIDDAAAAIDSIFQPLPLMRPADEEALRRHPNQAQLVRARALGVGRLLPAEQLEALEREERLIRLEDSEYWVIRDMDHSQPLAVPGVEALLTEIGRRFHARLDAMGAPAYRMEVTSLLRTAGDQAELRRVNPNAALGESTHEYGTTVDVLYSAFSAPVQPITSIEASDSTLQARLHRYAAVSAERVAGRRALELKAILAGVLREMQNEGAVMVTLERLQPVFHMTLAREL